MLAVNRKKRSSSTTSGSSMPTEHFVEEMEDEGLSYAGPAEKMDFYVAELDDVAEEEEEPEEKEESERKFDYNRRNDKQQRGG